MRICSQYGMVGGSVSQAASAETHRVLRDGGLLISITELRGNFMASWVLMDDHGYVYLYEVTQVGSFGLEEWLKPKGLRPTQRCRCAQKTGKSPET